MNQIDTILCNFIKLMPLVFDVNDAIEKAKLAKNTGRKFCYKFSYPSFGNTTFNQNALLYLSERALCSTPTSIFNEICYLVKNDDSNITRILEDILIYLYLVKSKFYGIQRAIATSRQYINTCKVFFYYFRIDIPIANKPNQTVKRYNNNQLMTLYNLANCKKLIDPFGFKNCNGNLEDLTMQDYENLVHYLESVESGDIVKNTCDNINSLPDNCSC